MKKFMLVTGTILVIVAWLAFNVASNNERKQILREREKQEKIKELKKAIGDDNPELESLYKKFEAEYPDGKAELVKLRENQYIIKCGKLLTWSDYTRLSDFDDRVKKLCEKGNLSEEKRKELKEKREALKRLNEEAKAKEAQRLKDEQSRLKKIADKVKNIGKIYDSFDRVYWINSRTNFDSIKIYAGTMDDTTYSDIWYRVIFKYSGRSWIFFDSVQFLVDNAVYTVDFKAAKRRDEIQYDGVSEEYDVILDAQILNICKRIKEAKTVRIRFKGDKASDRVLSERDRKNILRMLEFKELLE